MQREEINLLSLPHEIFLTQILPKISPSQIPKVARVLNLRLRNEDYHLLGLSTFRSLWSEYPAETDQVKFKQLSILCKIISENPSPPSTFDLLLKEEDYKVLGHHYFSKKIFEENRIGSNEETYDHLCGYTEIVITPHLLNLNNPDLTIDFEEHLAELIDWYSDRTAEIAEFFDLKICIVYGLIDDTDGIRICILVLGPEEKLRKKDPYLLNYLANPEDFDNEDSAILKNPITILEDEWLVLGEINKINRLPYQNLDLF